MTAIKDIIGYICLKYPFKDELSKARLTKLVYLADWASALLKGKQMTNVQWVFNHYGPYVDDVIDSARNDDNFKITQTQNMFGGYKERVSYSGEEKDLVLDDIQKAILNGIIEKTQKMYFNDFIDYVYATYPVKAKNRYSYLDLVRLAEEYKASK